MDDYDMPVLKGMARACVIAILFVSLVALTGMILVGSNLYFLVTS